MHTLDNSLCWLIMQYICHSPWTDFDKPLCWQQMLEFMQHFCLSELLLWSPLRLSHTFSDLKIQTKVIDRNGVNIFDVMFVIVLAKFNRTSCMYTVDIAQQSRSWKLKNNIIMMCIFQIFLLILFTHCSQAKK